MSNKVMAVYANPEAMEDGVRGLEDSGFEVTVMDGINTTIAEVLAEWKKGNHNTLITDVQAVQDAIKSYR